MYAEETEFLCPFFQDFSHEVQQLLLDSSMMKSPLVSEYDFGGESMVSLDQILDPMQATISMISFDDQELIPTQELQLINLESHQNDSFHGNVLYECKNSILTDDLVNSHTEEKQLNNESAFNSVPSFLDFSEMDVGMRRAFSEGDIKTLDSVNVRFIHRRRCSSEDRQLKLSRYRIKKLKRNFGRKIKYACRKALADSQPRIRGRFARTRDTLSHTIQTSASR